MGRVARCSLLIPPDLLVLCRGSGVDTTEMAPMLEWDLEGTYAILSEQKYTCCPNPYQDIIFSIKIKRVPNFYMYQVVWPGLLACHQLWHVMSSGTS